ncbi:MAG: DUF4282 domain-containing protein, partial [Propionibacteriales bacterium]|nr:DUF4282 domain-containing protein [Propionibacteriales bacterium]
MSDQYPSSDQYPVSNGPRRRPAGSATPYGQAPGPQADDYTHVMPAVQQSAGQPPYAHRVDSAAPWGGQQPSAAPPPVQEQTQPFQGQPASDHVPYAQGPGSGPVPQQSAERFFGAGQPPTQQDQAPNQPSGGAAPYGDPQPSPHGVGYTAQVPPPSPRAGRGDSNPLAALLDVGFHRYATPGLVKIVYILAVVVAVLCWLGGGISIIVTGVQLNDLDDGLGTPVVVLGVFALVLGWIPALLVVALTRIVLEFSAATVRTNTAVGEIADR